MSRILSAAVERFAGMRVAVMGDVMLDSYLEGEAGRLCREAPVPIVSVRQRHDAPGGAANAAANAASLGASVRLLGLVGRDEAAARLAGSLSTAGVDTQDLVMVDGRGTLAKQRISADGQLLLRFDEGTTDDPSSESGAALRHALAELHDWADVLVVSDYGYGVVTDELVTRLGELQDRRRRVLVADSKDAARLAPLRPAAVKPNYAEACQLSGVPAANGPTDRVRLVIDHRDRLLEATGAENVVVTLDGDGCVLLRRGRRPYRTYARPVANDRAAGAGDTVAAALALALGNRLDSREAVELASLAASVAVGKAGTATCSAQELLSALAGTKRDWTVDELRHRVELERGLGRRIVFTNGCFDILHPGHVAYLTRAKALGDVLVVAVNSDESVRRLKGEGRPVNSLADRLEVLGALSCVDYLVAFEQDTPAELIRALRPDLVTKGGDYSEETLPEAELVRSLGGEVRILPFVADRSTTRIIERIGGNPAAMATRPRP